MQTIYVTIELPLMTFQMTFKLFFFFEDFEGRNLPYFFILPPHTMNTRVYIAIIFVLRTGFFFNFKNAEYMKNNDFHLKCSFHNFVPFIFHIDFQNEYLLKGSSSCNSRPSCICFGTALSVSSFSDYKQEIDFFFFFNVNNQHSNNLYQNDYKKKMEN